MPTTWRIDIRLGEAPDAPLIRTAVLSADTEEGALRRLAEDLARSGDPTLLDGQEEVSAAGEFDPGSRMPRLEMRAKTSKA